LFFSVDAETISDGKSKRVAAKIKNKEPRKTPTKILGMETMKFAPKNPRKL
jgi:hypothetical protein